MNAFQQACLKDLGCYYDEHVLSFQACEVARRWRVAITERLMCEALLPDGDLLKIGQITKSRAEYMKALQDLVKWTYEICKLAGEEQGPAMFHVAAERCNPEPCRRLGYGGRMW
jgi:hypothetical protein